MAESNPFLDSGQGGGSRDREQPTGNPFLYDAQPSGDAPSPAPEPPTGGDGSEPPTSESQTPSSRALQRAMSQPGFDRLSPQEQMQAVQQANVEAGVPEEDRQRVSEAVAERSSMGRMLAVRASEGVTSFPTNAARLVSRLQVEPPSEEEAAQARAEAQREGLVNIHTSLMPTAEAHREQAEGFEAAAGTAADIGGFVLDPAFQTGFGAARAGTRAAISRLAQSSGRAGRAAQAVQRGTQSPSRLRQFAAEEAIDVAPGFVADAATGAVRGAADPDRSALETAATEGAAGLVLGPLAGGAFRGARGVGDIVARRIRGTDTPTPAQAPDAATQTRTEPGQETGAVVSRPQGEAAETPTQAIEAEGVVQPETPAARPQGDDPGMGARRETSEEGLEPVDVSAIERRQRARQPEQGLPLREGRRATSPEEATRATEQVSVRAENLANAAETLEGLRPRQALDADQQARVQSQAVEAVRQNVPRELQGSLIPAIRDARSPRRFSQAMDRVSRVLRTYRDNQQIVDTTTKLAEEVRRNPSTLTLDSVARQLDNLGRMPQATVAQRDALRTQVRAITKNALPRDLRDQVTDQMQRVGGTPQGARRVVARAKQLVRVNQQRQAVNKLDKAIRQANKSKAIGGGEKREIIDTLQRQGLTTGRSLDRQKIRRAAMSRASARQDSFNFAAQDIDQAAELVQSMQRQREIENSLIAGEKIADFRSARDQVVNDVRGSRAQLRGSDEADKAGMFNLIANGETLIRQMSRFQEDRPLYNTWVRQYSRSRDEVLREEQVARNWFHERANARYGMAADSADFDNYMNEVIVRLPRSDDPDQTLPLTRGELIDLAAHYDDPNTASLIPQSGVTLPRKSNVRLETEGVSLPLTEADRGFIDDLKAHVNQEGEGSIRDRVQRTMRNMFGQTLEMTDRWWSRSRAMSAQQGKQSEMLRRFGRTNLEENQRAAQEASLTRLESTGMVQSRTQATNSPFLIRDVRDSYRQIVKNQMEFAELSPVLRDMSMMLDNPDIQRAIKEHYGTNSLSFMRRLGENAAGAITASDNWWNNSVRSILRGFGTAKLGFSVWTGLRQGGGLLNALADDSITEGAITQALREGAFGRPDVRRRALSNSAEYFHRRNEDFLGAQFSGASQVDPSRAGGRLSRAIGREQGRPIERGVERVREWSFAPMKEVDDEILSTLYRASELDIGKNNPNLQGEAFERAVVERFESALHRTQGTDHPMYQTELDILAKQQPTIGATIMFQRELNRSANIVTSGWRRFAQNPTSENFQKAATGTLLVIGAGALYQDYINEWQSFANRGFTERINPRTWMQTIGDMATSELAGRVYVASNVGNFVNEAYIQENKQWAMEMMMGAFSGLAFSSGEGVSQIGAGVQQAIEGETFEQGPRRGESKAAQSFKDGFIELADAFSTAAGLPIWQPLLLANGMLSLSDSEVQGMYRLYGERQSLRSIQDSDDRSLSTNQRQKLNRLNNMIRGINRVKDNRTEGRMGTERATELIRERLNDGLKLVDQ